jgi:hypothetical protein
VLALYNESCSCNYISARFVREELQMDETEGDLVLVWVCKGLGRYEQRSVFWIAPNADFDLLFGQEDEFNSRHQEETQFNYGIESGILSKDLSSTKQRKEPRKSFQGGINDEFLLPVERSSTRRSTGKSPMPSLAEIKIQLAAQLDCSSERRLQHKKRRALNIFDPRYIFTAEDLINSKASEGTIPPTISIQDIPESDQTETIERIVRRNSAPLASDSTFKGNKRIHSEEHNSPSNTADRCPKSPKVRNRTARPMSTNLSLDHTFDHFLGEISKTATEPFVGHESTKIISVVQNINTQPIQEDLVQNSNKDQPLNASIGSPPDDILFSCMDRGISANLKIPHDSSSISLSSQHSDTLERNENDISQLLQSLDSTSAIKTSGKKTKGKRRKNGKSKISKDVKDWTNMKFDDFWTKDEVVNNWYHFDQLTQKTIWYDPPPLEKNPS